MVWAFSYGGNEDDTVADVALDAAGDFVYLVGSFKSPRIAFAPGMTIQNGAAAGGASSLMGSDDDDDDDDDGESVCFGLWKEGGALILLAASMSNPPAPPFPPPADDDSKKKLFSGTTSGTTTGTSGGLFTTASAPAAPTDYIWLAKLDAKTGRVVWAVDIGDGIGAFGAGWCILLWHLGGGGGGACVSLTPSRVNAPSTHTPITIRRLRGRLGHLRLRAGAVHLLRPRRGLLRDA